MLSAKNNLWARGRLSSSYLSSRIVRCNQEMKLSLPQYLLEKGVKVAGVEGPCGFWVSEEARLSIQSTEYHTGILAKGLDGLQGLGTKVQFPGVVCLLIGLAAPRQGRLILASNGLSVEDKERDHAICLPLIEIGLDTRPYARQAGEGGKKGLVGLRLELGMDVVGSIDGD
jgi:hypothetical protein